MESPATGPQDLWAELRPQLSHIGPAYPHEAVARIRAARESLAPLLVAELEALAADPSPAADDADYILHLHLLALLAEFRESRAYPAMLRLATRGEAEADAVLGDLATELIGRSLASVCAGAFDPLCVLADDVKVSPWLRGAALEAMVVCCLEGDAAQDDVTSRIAALAGREAERQLALPPVARSDMFVGAAVAHLLEVRGVAVLDSVRRWFCQGLVDPSICGDLEEVEREFERPFAERVEWLREWDKGYVRDAEAEMAGLGMFDSDLMDWPSEDDEADEADEGEVRAQAEPYVRDLPKVGRNDPCPCGSGKKYKKCCGAPG